MIHSIFQRFGVDYRPDAPLGQFLRRSLALVTLGLAASSARAIDVLAGLPIAMVGYFLMVNPGYLMSMWNDGTGRYLLLAAVALDITGTFVMWRMLRSI